MRRIQLSYIYIHYIIHLYITQCECRRFRWESVYIQTLQEIKHALISRAMGIITRRLRVCMMHDIDRRVSYHN